MSTVELTVLSLTAALVLNAGSAQAAWSLIDDFGGRATGSLVGGTAAPGGTWNDQGATATAQLDPADSSNTVLLFPAGANGESLSVDFSSSTSIATGSTGTLYYRFRTNSDPELENTDLVTGLTSVAAPSGFGNFKTGVRNQQFSMVDPNSDPRAPTNLYNHRFDVRDGDDGYEDEVSLLENDSWYSLWMVATNDLVPENIAGDEYGSYKLYLQSDDDAAYAAQTELIPGNDGNWFFRDESVADIISVFLRSGSANNGDVFFDDIWVNGSAADLSVPQVPEPTAVVLLASGIGMFLIRRR